MCFRCRRCSLPGERLSRRRHRQSVDCDRSNLSAHCRIDQQRPVASLSARLERQLQPDIALQGSHAECQMHCPFTRACFINYLCYVLYDLLAFTHLWTFSTNVERATNCMQALKRGIRYRKSHSSVRHTCTCIVSKQLNKSPHIFHYPQFSQKPHSLMKPSTGAKCKWKLWNRINFRWISVPYLGNDTRSGHRLSYYRTLIGSHMWCIERWRFWLS